MFLTATNVFHYLRDTGQASERDIVEENYGIVEIGRRNRNFKVLMPKSTSLFVKQVPMVHPETVSSFLKEAACAQLASESAAGSAIRSVMPTLRRYDPKAHVLVYESLDPSETLSECMIRTGGIPPGLAGNLGRALAACHVQTARPGALARIASALTGDFPWVLIIGQKAEMVMPNMSMGRRQVVDRIRATPDLNQGLIDLQSRWRRLCLVHGDMKWDNVLLVGQPGDQHLRLIDWELAELGEPLWDVASVLGSFLQFWLLNLPLHQVQGDRERALATTQVKITSIHRDIFEFWTGYCNEQAGLFGSGIEAIVSTARLVGARLILLAFELLPTDTTISLHAGLALDLAQYFLTQPERATQDLLGIDPRSFASPRPEVWNRSRQTDYIQ